MVNTRMLDDIRRGFPLHLMRFIRIIGLNAGVVYAIINQRKVWPANNTAMTEAETDTILAAMDEDYRANAGRDAETIIGRYRADYDYWRSSTPDGVQNR